MNFNDKVLLITGGTGSFGNAVLSRFLKTGIREIRVFSRDEKKQEDMRLLFADAKLKFYIGDVRDRDSVDKAIDGVDYVFHAAALKQVPSCEFHPMEAVRTNILGTENVLASAVLAGVRKVVVLSTDKAVYPINAMGISKAMAEKLMVAYARANPIGPTVVCATRYGNVMASRGSVIPLFIAQIKAGKPVTVTDPSMTRFLMSLEESVELVLHAFGHAQSGDIFVQKSPACSVGDLAQALSGLLGRDTGVQVIGTRHGEKLYETLLSREEVAKAETSPKYFRVPMDIRDLNYSKYFVEGSESFSGADDYTSHNTTRLGVAEVKALLARLPAVREAIGA